MGCSALHYLAKLGVNNTVLLERDGLADGSTGRSMAILRMHYSNVVTTRDGLVEPGHNRRIRRGNRPSRRIREYRVPVPGQAGTRRSDAAKCRVGAAARGRNRMLDPRRGSAPLAGHPIRRCRRCGLRTAFRLRGLFGYYNGVCPEGALRRRTGAARRRSNGYQDPRRAGDRS